MAEPYSPLRYPGGKSKLAPFLIEFLKDRHGATHYIEPYAGGAGAALRLLIEEHVEVITINDADPCIYAFWSAATEHPERFIERVLEAPLTVAEWRTQRQIYEERNTRRSFDLGFATFFLNRTTHSGIIHNGGPIGGYEQQGKYKIGARFNRQQLAERINRIGAYSDRIEVSSRDGLSLLRALKSAGDAAHTFCYIDPPYYKKGPILYLNTFKHRDHASLAEFLSSETRFSWLVTYDNVDEIRALYARNQQLPFSLSYSAYRRRNGKELLILPPGVALSDQARDAIPAMVA